MRGALLLRTGRYRNSPLRTRIVVGFRKSPKSGTDLGSFPDAAALRDLAARKQGVDPDLLSRAQQLIYDAWEEPDRRRRMALARRALSISPFCADAWLLLTTLRSIADDARREMLERAVLAAELAIGEESFKANRGSFWGVLETRPYMRARYALAEHLWFAGEQNQAIEHLREMLILNPNDNQGLRYQLLAWLLWVEDDRSAEQLLRAHRDEGSAFLDYTRALLVFRKGGDSKAARIVVKRAWESNTHVPKLLAAGKVAHAMPEFYRPGGEDEAQCYLSQYGFAWERTAGATRWLVDITTDLELGREAGTTVH